MKFRLLPPFLLVGALAGAAFLGGCGPNANATNEPAPADIDKANAARAAAIDNDPKMTQAQKDEMKKHLSLGKYGVDNAKQK